MKQKLVLMALTFVLSANLAAQYKKASFFTRNGKFYGAKAGVHLFGNGVSATPSIAFIYGKDQGKNRIWHWWDLEYTAGSKYRYTTSSNADGSTVAVSGKVKGMLTWRYNWCVYLADNTNEELKGLPFVKAAVEAVLAGRSYGSETTTPENYDTKKITYVEGANGGLDIGAGYTYRVGETATVFGVAGYRWLLNDSDNYEGTETFFPNPSHPYINIGIRFARKNDE